MKSCEHKVLISSIWDRVANAKWTTDITKFKYAEGKLYLSPIKDLFNNEIIMYDLSLSPKFEQIPQMMKQAVTSLENAKPILHSDNATPKNKRMPKKLKPKSVKIIQAFDGYTNLFTILITHKKLHKYLTILFYSFCQKRTNPVY